MRQVVPYLAAVALLAGCGGAPSHESWDPPASLPKAAAERLLVPGYAASRPAGARIAFSPGAAGAPSPTCDEGAFRKLRSADNAYAALVKQRLTVLDAPGGRVVDRLEVLNVNGFPTVLGVLGELVDRTCERTWLLVQVPRRPNGSRGYVRADQVELRPVRTRIEIDLSRRSLRFYEGGRLVREIAVGIGAPDTPTPVGSYYVNQRLTTSDATGPWGPGGLGISAFSPVLLNWPQGGPIAIHGTNAPSSIGQALSHGCVRVDNTLLRWLFRRTAAGTPVTIRA
jgi:hypothetical protein